MALTLRPYQSEAIAAIFEYWQNEPGNPLLDLATGTGKSAIAATLTIDLIKGWTDMRVVSITHVAELIEQNYEELIGMWPFAPAGIYSAGLSRRDHHAQILFAGIQTVHSKAEQIGHIDVLIVDEAHLIPANTETMYGRFIAAARAINPDLKIVGLTATPFRLDSGRLDQGDDRLFDKVVYTYGIADGIRDGYLAPLTSKATATGFDLSGVGTLGGDYKQGALQAAVDKTEITKAAVAEIVNKGSDRRSWLIFGSGVEHALHIRDEIRAHGFGCETITGDTPKAERAEIIAAFKNYELRALTNNSVLTTGFNHKGVDLIGFLRPTKSLSLYLQMAGRGTRTVNDTSQATAEERREAIANSAKPNCLVLDFAKLAYTHGPVDMVVPETPGKGSGEAPVKQCPQCDELIHISVMKCHCCGYDFPPSEEIKLTANAGSAPIISTDIDMWRVVTRRSFAEHPGKEGKPDSVKTSFSCGLLGVNNWLCPGHTGFAKTKADRFWRDHGGQMPYPANAVEWLMRQLELNDTAEIELEYNGKYANAKNYRASGMATPMQADEYEVERDYRPVAVKEWTNVLDGDEIPF